MDFMLRYRLLAINVDGTLVNSSDEPDAGHVRGPAANDRGGHPRRAGHGPPL